MSEGALKPGWRRVELGEVVRLVTDRCDPAANGIERYVGLEHIEPSDLRVRNWGLVADGTTFTSHFRPGQVLFGKRRAYQRKVAVADFEGVCSGDIYILESKTPKVLRPELLPFICQTDRFFNHAVGTSAGSLSPRTNWTSLAKYELLLPPVDEQIQILHHLHTIEGAITSLQEARDGVRISLNAIIQWMATGYGVPLDERGQVSAGGMPKGYSKRTLRELCLKECGLVIGPFGSDLVVADYGDLKFGTPVLFVQDVQRFSLQHESRKFVSAEKHAVLKAHEALPRDVLVTKMGWPPGEACVVPDSFAAAIITADVIRLRPNTAIVSPLFLASVLNSYWGQKQIVRVAPGTTRPKTTLRDFGSIQVLVPPITVQSECDEQVLLLLAALANVDARIDLAQKVKREMLMLELGGPDVQ